MPDLIVTFFFLGVPLLAGLAGSMLVHSAYADLRSRPEEADAISMARPRLPVFFALAFFPFVLGLALWYLVASTEAAYGALTAAAYVVVEWMAIGFAAVSAVAVAAQGWLARARLRAFISTDFGRVLPAMAVPDTSVIFALVLGFLALGLLPEFLSSPPTLSTAAADEIALVFQIYALASLSTLAGIGLSLRVREISTPQGFLRMVSLAEVAVVLPIAALVWGFLQLGAL